MSTRGQVPDPTRRRVLAAAGVGAAAATSGCLGRLRSIFGWQIDGSVSLKIGTLPADTDPYALRIARQVKAWFSAAGINTQVVPTAEKELRQQVLLQHGFDVFVGRMPHAEPRPDTLYSLLHSTGVPSPGWQNPFGYANLGVDDLLETQRRTTGQERRNAVAAMQRSLARTQPFSIVGFPDDIRAVRTDRYANWENADLRSPLGYLALSRAEGEVETPGELRVVTTRGRTVGNLNPLAVEFRDRGPITDLLYDSLGRRYGENGGIEPWLATSWQFVENSETPRLDVQLRPNAVWHDGKSLTAEDVRFTYEFLADTSARDSDNVIPVPRYRGESSLVDEVRVLGDDRIEIAFTDCSRAVAMRALTVPILPAHVWRQRRNPATIGGVTVSDVVTEALVTDNTPPVGSGPLQFDGNPSGRLALTRFDDHFLHTGAQFDGPAWLQNGVAFDRLVVRVAVSELTAAGSVADGTVDAAVSPLGAKALPRIEDSDDAQKLVEQSPSFYFVGYNARRSPLTNPRFRNLLGRLIDKEYLVENVFEGHATPAASPLAGSDWLPTDLEWGDGDPMTPFYGSDGTLDEERVEKALETAGYQYDAGDVVKR
ncbi:ABC transporter substrate-binding protein [Halorientalis brevis]|uniref:ABC transporter substrate-binding protein n=1 Tax=Halorientalis brevis TaxID=1126241 RepID=A0ABD6C7A9_9EURY|nr:ABC transporter substrate-binding protein [Halorientalis brevis]